MFIDAQDDRRAADIGLVGIGLARIDPAAALGVLDALDRLADILDPDRRTLAIGDDLVVPVGGIGHLIVGVDRRAAGGADQIALGRVDGVGDQLLADGVQLKTERRRLARIDLHADGGLLLALDIHLADAGEAGDLLAQDAVGIVAD